MTESQREKFAHRDPTSKIFEPVVILKPSSIRIGAHSRIDSFVKIEGGDGVDIGKHVHISSFCHVGIGGGAVVLEDGCGLASGAKILSGSNTPAGQSMSASAPPEQQHVVRSRTAIGRNAFVGTNAVVLPGLTIGEGAVIAACALVTKDVPPFEIWGGAPARRIGRREDHIGG